MKETKYIASCSFGKDSIASIILAHEHGDPIDVILYSHVWYDKKKGISAEFPEHYKFIHEVAIPKFKEWGYKVVVVESDTDYREWFMKPCKKIKGKSNGGIPHGYPIPGLCSIQRDMKLKPIQEFYETFEYPYMQYVGIAIDEPDRLEALHKRTDAISLLEKYKFREVDAEILCKKYGLYSPMYHYTERGGCWFCPNAKLDQLRVIREQQPEVWADFLSLGEVFPRARINFDRTHTIQWLERQLKLEDAQMNMFEFIGE